MPSFNFGTEETSMIEEILSDLDPATDDLVPRHRGPYTEEGWAFVCDYVARALRQAVENAVIEDWLQRRKLADIGDEERLTEEGRRFSELVQAFPRHLRQQGQDPKP
jgi:hypothetical protein